VVSLLTVRLDNRAVVTLVYENPSKVQFTEIGNPWLILGPYLDKVSDLATGILPYVIGDFNFDFPNRNRRSWQRQIRDNLEDRGYIQVNEVTNLGEFQNDQVWVQNTDHVHVEDITSMFILTKNDHTAIQGWLKGRRRDETAREQKPKVIHESWTEKLFFTCKTCKNRKFRQFQFD
jgi:hypothetical protein